ncbi:hypothetical protein OHJ16_11620 [Actinomyces israelii]|uniref:Uncharacterized protein n=1 Tax=Actinomyces israelii TaxID=1659 RepID=A0ABT4IAB6_9ACTO|nr:hypothetical protein [Actinomyces israelii]MCZ0858688.1 hypothetical protein [Actinomyces israelii]
MTQARFSSRDHTSRPWAPEAEAARAGTAGWEAVSDDGAEAAAAASGRPGAVLAGAPGAAEAGTPGVGEADGSAVDRVLARIGAGALLLPDPGRPGAAARAGAEAGGPAAPRPAPGASWAAVTATCWLATTTR